MLGGQRNGSPRSYSRLSSPEPLLFLPNLVVPGIEPETSGTVARNFDHRGGAYEKQHKLSQERRPRISGVSRSANHNIVMYAYGCRLV
jgi:hypothetical protein